MENSHRSDSLEIKLLLNENTGVRSNKRKEIFSGDFYVYYNINKQRKKGNNPVRQKCYVAESREVHFSIRVPYMFKVNKMQCPFTADFIKKMW